MTAASMRVAAMTILARHKGPANDSLPQCGADTRSS
jgi:hypothetical protein